MHFVRAPSGDKESDGILREKEEAPFQVPLFENEKNWLFGCYELVASFMSSRARFSAALASTLASASGLSR